MQYNLEQLGPTGFQDLAAALATAEFGGGVQVMGAGRDGGRDLYFRGALTWRTREGQVAEIWDGYTVFQVKHKNTLAARPADNAAWLWGEIRKELDEWAGQSEKRNPVPEHLVIITNVPLTPTPGSGGHDSLNTKIDNYIKALSDDSRDVNAARGELRKAKLERLSRIQKWRFWDANAIQPLLLNHDAVRRGFPAFFTAADVFANLAEVTEKLPLTELEPGLRAHARSTLTGEGQIYFDEAGSGDGSGFPVHEVAVDLPVISSDGTQNRSAICYVLDRAEHMLKPRITTLPSPRHLVITGAPGNGKTTLSKLLVQSFRASMLSGSEDLSGDQRSVIEGTEAALRRVGRGLPRHRRWAMRIDLAEYAQEGGLDTDSTLLKRIAHKVSARSDAGTVGAPALKSWMRQWPWFLMLDGLDEVTEPGIRKRLIQQVTEFVNEAEAENCDVLVIVTTRPVGYTENIAPTQFEQIDLDYLAIPEAVRYGTLATKVRLRADTDRIEKVVRHLNEAASDEALQHLLRTPLQILILTIIIDGAGQLAPDRYSLFWNYYETVFRRERDKPGSLQHLLREHAPQIQQLHERVGFELQVRSEAGDRSYATLDYDELHQIAWDVLDEDEFKPSGKDSHLLEQILTAATRRLVLIAPRGDEGYGFDVRSLQEMTAALRLTTGPLEQVLERLRISAANPHWRNTWIFAAGRLFSTPQPHQHQAVVELIETLDQQALDRLGPVVPVGPRLALEIIDDGMARSLPKWRNRIMAKGLETLLEPAAKDLPAITRILVRYADTGEEQSSQVADGIRDALQDRAAGRATAQALQERVPSIAADLNVGLRAKSVARALRRPNVRNRAEAPDGWENFDLEFLTATIPEHLADKAAAAQQAIHDLKTGDPDREPDREAVMAAAADPQVGPILSAALTHVLPHEPRLLLLLRRDVLPALYRQPIGGLLAP